MALFDQFGPAQANNGQGQPNQPPVGAPGFNFQNWGHTPPNMAGGLQQFLRGGQPNAGQQPGGPMPGGPQMSTGFMPQMGQMQGAPLAGGPNGTASGVMPQANMMGNASGAPDAALPPNVMGAGGMTASGTIGNAGNTNLAGGMQQYLGARPR